mmetsp:Transcript_2186/g.5590  ORF Transcript_2186/g.5590 Transcript_2186/m.5590 type:complete len:243 (-) Transcript_2186:673-1401(-)
MGFANEQLDLNAPSMRRLMQVGGLTAPVGASPGELRLWLKMNNLLDDGHNSVRKQPAKPQRRASAERTRLAPIGGNGDPPSMVGYTSGKTAGRRGGRTGRSGSVEAALNAARAQQAARPASQVEVIAQGEQVAAGGTPADTSAPGSGWQQGWSEHGVPYYFHSESRVSQWEEPDGWRAPQASTPWVQPGLGEQQYQLQQAPWPAHDPYASYHWAAQQEQMRMQMHQMHQNALPPTQQQGGSW